MPGRPPLVERAHALGFEHACSDETGRLLHVLAGMRGRLRVAESGAGAGVRAAWIVSALDPGVPFFAAELDEGRAAAVAELFRDDRNVHVLPGDWHETLAREAPFDLLVLEAGEEDGELALGLLAPRGLLVIGGAAGPGRESWLGHPELAATEVPVSPREALILAVRTR